MQRGIQSVLVGICPTTRLLHSGGDLFGLDSDSLHAGLASHALKVVGTVPGRLARDRIHIISEVG